MDLYYTDATIPELGQQQLNDPVKTWPCEFYEHTSDLMNVYLKTRQVLKTQLNTSSEDLARHEIGTPGTLETKLVRKIVKEVKEAVETKLSRVTDVY
jgi:hypothetical protein